MDEIDNLIDLLQSAIRRRFSGYFDINVERIVEELKEAKIDLQVSSEAAEANRSRNKSAIAEYEKRGRRSS